MATASAIRSGGYTELKIGMIFGLSQHRILCRLRGMSGLTHDELARLSPPERLALISQLWDSLEADELPLTAKQGAELDRRLETLDQDRREGIPWEALKVELAR